jgi:hypothetical protein
VQSVQGREGRVYEEYCGAECCQRFVTGYGADARRSCRCPLSGALAVVSPDPFLCVGHLPPCGRIATAQSVNTESAGSSTAVGQDTDDDIITTTRSM